MASGRTDLQSYSLPDVLSAIGILIGPAALTLFLAAAVATGIAGGTGISSATVATTGKRKKRSWGNYYDDYRG